MAPGNLAFRNLTKAALLLMLAGAGYVLLRKVGISALTHMESLEWVESASPNTYFQRDSQNGEYHFYVTYGVAPEIPGVGTITFDRCYADVADLIEMRDTSDVFESGRQGILDSKARTFALEYNRMMRAFVDAKGLSKCPPRMDWEAATNDLYTYIADSDERGGFSIHVDEKPSRLGIELKDKSRAERIRRTTCSLLARNGINELVKIDVSHWLMTPTPGFHSIPIGTFECAKGMASPLVRQENKVDKSHTDGG